MHLKAPAILSAWTIELRFYFVFFLIFALTNRLIDFSTKMTEDNSSISFYNPSDS